MTYKLQFFGINTWHDAPVPERQDYPFLKLKTAISYGHYKSADYNRRTALRVIDSEGYCHKVFNYFAMNRTN